MGYRGGSLTSLFDKTQQALTKETMRTAATAAAGVWLEATRGHTPIDTGELQMSWQQGNTRKVALGYESSIYTHIDYAPHVEYGTGLWGPKHAKYPITAKRPGGMLRWYDPKSGQPVFRRSVMHPGSPGAHMVSKGGTDTLVAIEGGLWEPIARAYAEAVVRNAD